MRILVTGITSFMGCHIAAGYRSMGHDVVGTQGPSGDAEGIRGERLACLRGHGVPLVSLDMRDAEAVRRCAAEVQPDVWVQHAGYTKSYATHDYDLALGHALNVAPLAAIYSVMAESRGAVIITGSVAEYSDSEEPHKETDVCAPSMPYGLSKLTETLYAQQLASRYGVPTRVARLFLPFGPLDAPEKMLSSTINSLKNGLPMPLSPCIQRRDFLHMDDVVSLYQKLLPDLAKSEFEIYNVCSGESRTLRDVLTDFAGTLQADPALCQFGAIPMRPGEPQVIRGSNAKARENLGWSPTPWMESVRKFCSAY